MNRLIAAFATLSLLAAAPASANAAPCKDAKGKFISCPKPAPAVKKGPCKDSKGKFVKCADARPAAPAKKAPCKDAKGKFVKC